MNLKTFGKSPSQRAGITDCYKEFFVTFLENYCPVTKNKWQERAFQNMLASVYVKTEV